MATKNQTPTAPGYLKQKMLGLSNVYALKRNHHGNGLPAGAEQVQLFPHAFKLASNAADCLTAATWSVSKWPRVRKITAEFTFRLARPNSNPH